MASAAAPVGAATTLDIHLGKPTQGKLPGTETTREYLPIVLTVNTPAGDVNARAPADIAIALDISGSMGTAATLKSADGVETNDGLTFLDVAKHAVRTVIESLGDEDRLSIVAFDHMARNTLPLTNMNEAGRQEAMEKTEELRECGGTVIWEGLKMCMDNLVDGENAYPGRMRHIFLLTDGQTQYRDELIGKLQEYAKATRNQQLPGSVSTFGFGYGIDSELLCQIADYGDGAYSFIPDPGMVGTVFINTLANALTTFASEAVLDIKLDAGWQVLSVMGDLKHSEIPADGSSGTNLQVTFAGLQYGQARSAVVLTAVPSGEKGLSARLDFQVAGKNQSSNEVTKKSGDQAAPAMVEPQVLRCEFIETVRHNVMGQIDKTVTLEAAEGNIQQLGQKLASCTVQNELVKGLAEDVAGQSREAFSKSEWYNKWGRHYMPSIMFAHRLQQCNNFKDPSVQVYGGDMFKELQDKGDQIFDRLPPPKPRARPTYGGYGGGGAAAAPAAAPQPVNMSAYNDRYGVCIDASSQATLADGRLCRVGDLRKGDLVAAPGGKAAEVLCVVRTECVQGRASLVELQAGVRLTPFHPVYVSGAWNFPADIAQTKEYACEAVCSLVLEGATSLLLGEGSEGQVAAIALGHGLTDDDVATHDYFGSRAVVKDLESAPGFHSGLVEVKPENVIRDPCTGLVHKFRF